MCSCLLVLLLKTYRKMTSSLQMFLLFAYQKEALFFLKNKINFLSNLVLPCERMLPKQEPRALCSGAATDSMAPPTSTKQSLYNYCNYFPSPRKTSLLTLLMVPLALCVKVKKLGFGQVSDWLFGTILQKPAVQKAVTKNTTVQVHKEIEAEILLSTQIALLVLNENKIKYLVWNKNNSLNLAVPILWKGIVFFFNREVYVTMSCRDRIWFHFKVCVKILWNKTPHPLQAVTD